MRSALALSLCLLLSPSCTASTSGQGQTTANPKLLAPEAANETAPDSFRVALHTTKGKVVVEVDRGWAPRGADRFYNLVRLGFFEDLAFFRAIDGFMVQFGIHGDPAVAAAWKAAAIEDDPRIQANVRGTVSFANRGPGTRTTQIFINYADHPQLDAMTFTPFGTVVEGMDVVDAFYTGYGEGAPSGDGPDQRKIERQGNAYLRKQFPKLDYLQRAELLPASL